MWIRHEREIISNRVETEEGVMVEIYDSFIWGKFLHLISEYFPSWMLDLKAVVAKDVLRGHNLLFAQPANDPKPSVIIKDLVTP